MACTRFFLWPFSKSSQILVFDERGEIEEHLLAEICVRIAPLDQPEIVLASGATFSGFFARVRQRIDDGELDFSRVVFHHLDEFHGVGPMLPGSLSAEIAAGLFPDPHPMRGRFHPIDATSPDAVTRHEERVSNRDLVLLGIGANGHLAFNEPGTPLRSRTHIAALTAQTCQVHSDRFPGGRVPTHAVTAGLDTILSGRELILVATGASKADAIEAALLGPIGPACPASAIRLHDRVTVLLDRPAASKLLDRARISTSHAGLTILGRESLAPPGPVLVVAPHPDDASISCGGLLASLPAEVVRHIVTFSTGARAAGEGLSPHDAAALREREARAEAEVLGAKPHFLRAAAYDSGGFEPQDAAALGALLETIRPAWVLAPARNDPHPTHRLCRLTVEEALRGYLTNANRSVELWTFEGPWCQLERDDINVLVRIDAAARDRKQRGITCHASQISRVPFQDGAAALETLRAIAFSESHFGGRQPSGFPHDTRLEAFHRLTVSPVRGL